MPGCKARPPLGKTLLSKLLKNAYACNEEKMRESLPSIDLPAPQGYTEKVTRTKDDYHGF